MKPGPPARHGKLRQRAVESGLIGPGRERTQADLERLARGGTPDGGHWIAGATENHGALHRKLGIPEGETIPAKRLKKAEHSADPTERKEATLAENLKHLPHKG